MTGKACWRLASASAVGTSHLTLGTPCQDHHAIEIIESDEGRVLVAAVSDGAGSAAHSDKGSWLASTTFVELVEVFFGNGGRIADLDRAQALKWLARVASALEAQAAGSNHSTRDYACTLLAAIVGEREGAFFQIGDGAMVVSHGPKDGWSYVFWPQHGQYANSTNFVTSDNAADVLDFEIAPRRIDEIALFSDGLEKLVLHDASRSVHEQFFSVMFPPVRRGGCGANDPLSDGLARYLSSPAVCERTDDDKTLVLATRLQPIEAA